MLGDAVMLGQEITIWTIYSVFDVKFKCNFQFQKCNFR